MKKVSKMLAMLLALVMVFALFGCGAKPADDGAVTDGDGSLKRIQDAVSQATMSLPAS